MEIKTPLPIGPYGTDLRRGENLYFFIDKEYCFKPFHLNDWNIVKNNGDVLSTILTCCDQCEITYYDDNLTPVHHMEDRVNHLFDKIMEMYENTKNVQAIERLTEDPYNITKKDIENVGTILRVYTILFDHQELEWNMDNMVQFLLFPQKVFFFFYNNGQYYPMFPKNHGSIVKKYQSVITKLPSALESNIIFENYPKYYKQKNLWLKMVKFYFMKLLDPLEWTMHKVPKSPNALLHCFILFTKHLKKVLLTSPAEEVDKIEHYRNVLSFHYKLLDDEENVSRIENKNNPITNEDFYILANRSGIWGFLYQYTGRGFGYWNYYHRQYYNIQPLGIMFILELQPSEEYVILTPKETKDEWRSLCLTTIPSNYTLEEKSISSKKETSKAKDTSKKQKTKKTPLEKDKFKQKPKKVEMSKKKETSNKKEKGKEEPKETLKEPKETLKEPKEKGKETLKEPKETLKEPKEKEKTKEEPKKRKRCPKGTRLDKRTNECVEKTNFEKLKQIFNKNKKKK